MTSLSCKLEGVPQSDLVKLLIRGCPKSDLVKLLIRGCPHLLPIAVEYPSTREPSVVDEMNRQRREQERTERG